MNSIGVVFLFDILMINKLNVVNDNFKDHYSYILSHAKKICAFASPIIHRCSCSMVYYLL